MKIYKILLLLFIVTIGCADKGDKNIQSNSPILILVSQGNFGEYTGEILKTQGFNSFDIISISDNILTLDYLKKYDIVILTETPLIDHQAELISNYVKGGGNLISFKPDKSISDIFGLIDKVDTLSEGYISIDTNTEIGKGLLKETLQFHGAADLYELGGATKLADLFADANKSTDLPAVCVNKFGKGTSIAFTYNLPKNIVYTRQGNPGFAGIEKDGILGLRGMDLHTDGWVDVSKNTINQADEHMHLFVHCLENLTLNTKPLPRIWYFPDSLNCLAVLDNDGEFSGEADFEPQFQDVDSMGAKMTLFVLDLNKISKEWVDKWTAKGFEISAHPDNTIEAANPTWNRMDSVLTDIQNRFRLKYGLSFRTVVNHWFVLVGRNADGTQNFGAQARLEENHGIEMDANYAHYDMNSTQGKYFLGPLGYNQGNYIGSGFVMKYADSAGKTINVYQRFNAVYDQQYMESKDSDGFFNCFKGLVDRSLGDEVYSIVSIKSHNDEYHMSRKAILKMLAYANENDVPVWTALNLLDFLKMKDEATFNNIQWINNQMSFALNSSLSHSNGLSFMIPSKYNKREIEQILINGKNNNFHYKKVKGSDYAFVTVKPGVNYEVLIEYR
jgi:hypothetical protein